jgi:deoxyribodipyrimidine photo-lyase
MWFRRDLRLKDNPALTAAVNNGTLVPIFILDNSDANRREQGAASDWWLHHSLNSLNQSLDGHLQVLVGDPLSLLPELVKKWSIDSVVWNRCYEPEQMTKDTQLKSQLREQGTSVASFNGQLLWEPMNIRNKTGRAYKVFTPYYRKGCLGAQPPRYPIGAPTKITYAQVSQEGLPLDSLNLLPEIKWYSSFAKEWQPGEHGASLKLSRYIHDASHNYKNQRDFPGVQGTSRLSAHLHFGEISPHQVWYALFDAFEDKDNTHLDTFLSELGWREFSYYLLFHYPHITEQNFNAKFNQFQWRTASNDLTAWQQGRTGIPIVDAGMRELWQTGFIHNRVRMIVGSFLVKNLLIDWRQGEAWFWDCLVDADLASNCASWQWIAGSGADAAPYFRVFNPVLQGEKFDKQGEYLLKYCPELAKLPLKYIHQPWEAPNAILRQAGVILGQTYPAPIVDLKASRLRALDTYQQMKEIVNASASL